MRTVYTWFPVLMTIIIWLAVLWLLTIPFAAIGTLLHRGFTNYRIYSLPNITLGTHYDRVIEILGQPIQRGIRHFNTTDIDDIVTTYVYRLCLSYEMINMKFEQTSREIRYVLHFDGLVIDFGPFELVYTEKTVRRIDIYCYTYKVIVDNVHMVGVGSTKDEVEWAFRSRRRFNIIRDYSMFTNLEVVYILDRWWAFHFSFDENDLVNLVRVSFFM